MSEVLQHAPQTLAAGSTLALTIAGSRVVDTGVSIETQPASFEITKSGLYHIAADIVIDASAAGDVTFYALLDGVQMPCTVKSETLVADRATAIHTETDVSFASCCGCVSHTITFAIASTTTAAGTVSAFCSGVLKEA